MNKIDIPNKEDYVMKFTTDNLRMKIKFHNYIARHKGKKLTVNAIKRSIKKMENINLNNIPDECYPEVREIKHERKEIFNAKKHKPESEYADIVTINHSVRDVIEAIKQAEYASIFFAMYRGKPYYKLIWNLL